MPPLCADGKADHKGTSKEGVLVAPQGLGDPVRSWPSRTWSSPPRLSPGRGSAPKGLSRLQAAVRTAGAQGEADKAETLRRESSGDGEWGGGIGEILAVLLRSCLSQETRLERVKMIRAPVWAPASLKSPLFFVCPLEYSVLLNMHFRLCFCLK